MTRSLRIAVVTPRYTLTGVPLAQWRFAKALAKAGHEVHLIIGNADPGLRVPPAPGVAIKVLHAQTAKGMFCFLVSFLRRMRPDAVFAAEDHLNGILLFAAIVSGSRAKISGSSRVPPSDSYSNTPFTKGWFRKQLMRGVMWRADALTCVSRDMVKNYRVFFPKGPHVAVYNIINDADARRRAAEPVDHGWFVDPDVPVIVAAGTLTRRKAFDDLLEAVALLVRRGRDVRVAIFGEGHMRGKLEAIAAEKLPGRVWLPGRIDNPLAYFSKAPISALTSRAEGLPNVLVEAMICGCTPVATDCPTGPRELLGDGDAGYLAEVGDPVSIAAALESALAKPIAQQALRKATEPFTATAVIARHFALLGLDDA